MLKFPASKYDLFHFLFQLINDQYINNYEIFTPNGSPRSFY